MFDVQQGQSWNFVIDSEDTLFLDTKLCVPGADELRKEIMESSFLCFQYLSRFYQDVYDLKDTY